MRLRLEASRRLGQARFYVDGTLLASFDTDFDDTGARIKLDSGAPSVTSSSVAFSNVTAFRGVCP